MQPLGGKLVYKPFAGCRQIFMCHFTCLAQTKGAEKKLILSSKLQISFLYNQANTILSTAVTDWATTCANAESCNWGIPVDRFQKGQLY